MSSSREKKRVIYNKRNTHKQQFLDINLKGFLCYCNNREKECIRESYNILNKFADVLYGTNNANVAKVDDQTEDKDANEIDISDALSSELGELKSNDAKKKLFQATSTGAKNIIFIRTTLENPVEIVEKIVSDIEETKVQQTRFLIRLLPIEVTCKAHVKDIVAACEPLIEKYFKECAKVFSIVFNHRNNSSLSKDEVIKQVADVVAKTRDDHKVNLKQADVSIVIEIIGRFAFIGVVPKFFQYKKYNLLAVAGENLASTEIEDVKD